jgi:hypothetical protein
VAYINIGIRGRGLPEQTFQIEETVLILIGLIRDQPGGGWIQNLNGLAPGFKVGEKNRFLVPDQFRHPYTGKGFFSKRRFIHPSDQPFSVPDKNPGTRGNR